MTTFVLLFRGINVGGHQAVRMDALKELHESLGLQEVQTYIQIGNVVFTSDEADVTQIQKDIEDGFAQKFGFRVNVMVRTADELNVIIENNPFQNQPMKESKWVVAMFLATHPISTALEDIQKTYTGPEELHITGQEVYIYYPKGIGRSKLTNTFLEKKLLSNIRAYKSRYSGMPGQGSPHDPQKIKRTPSEQMETPPPTRRQSPP